MKKTILTFILISRAMCWAEINVTPMAEIFDVSYSNTQDSMLVVQGIIVKKEEIWNRRSNPLMGRPDWLEEIRLALEVGTVIKGVLSQDIYVIILSVKDQKMLASNDLAEGDRAIFYCVDMDSLYRVYEYQNLEKNFRPVAQEIKPVIADSGAKNPNQIISAKEILTPEDVAMLLENPENISGRMIQKHDNLRNGALQKIAGQYKLSQAEVITLTSFSGPTPPDGGYIYWGVTGMLNGKWVIWQQGYEGLREGKVLTDPLRFQK